MVDAICEALEPRMKARDPQRADDQGGVFNLADDPGFDKGQVGWIEPPTGMDTPTSQAHQCSENQRERGNKKHSESKMDSLSSERHQNEAFLSKNRPTVGGKNVLEMGQPICNSNNSVRN
eukprot:EG_transcript_27797